MEKSRVLLIPLLILALVAATAACGGGEEEAETVQPPKEWTVMTFTVSSPAFQQGQRIPAKYTCDGEDISPPLQWSDVPEGTTSFALIMDDPDAVGGTWVHWVLFNIPANANSLDEAVPPDAELTDGSRHGKNSWGSPGYGGPCPPSGTHRYVFNLYALDKMLDLPTGSSAEQVTEAMEGHKLAAGVVMGVYSRD